MGSENDTFIDDVLHGQERRFCSYDQARFFVTTFNVNGRSPPEYLGGWLEFDNENLPDFVVVGLQEMDLALGTYVTDNPSRQHEWLFVLHRNLPNTYVQIDCVRLIGIFLVIYQLRPRPSKFKVQEVRTCSVPTGFLKFGNKGGVGISMRINDSSFCFVNSHLAAGSSELSRRNQDYRDISQMKFTETLSIYDHDAVIWLGDLNYRLDAPLSYEEVVRECNSARVGALFAFDQLREQQRLSTAFNNFHEQVPEFRPTYKFDVGTSDWDTSEKRRVPAWCDRILYFVKDKDVKLKQTQYRSHESIKFSDHKPVSTLFLAEVRTEDKAKKAQVLAELYREGDRETNKLVPSVSLSQTDISFGPVFFRQPAVRALKITNKGLTATRFTFASKHQNKDLPEDWLTLTPKSSFIDVGDTVEVVFQACVDNKEAWKISAPTELNCILVLRLDKGGDYFVVVSAAYAPSCFGSSLDMLLGREPAPAEPEQWLIDLDDSAGGAGGGPGKDVPPQVFHMAQALRQVGLNKVQLDAPFSDDFFFRVRDCLDAKNYQRLYEFARESPSNLFSTLYVFLRSLRTPLLAAGLPQLRPPGTEAQVYLGYVRSLASPVKEVFNFLVIFFRELNAVRPLNDDQLQMLACSVLGQLSPHQLIPALRFTKWCLTGKLDQPEPLARVLS